MNAAGLGRWARSGIADCGAGSASESLIEASDLATCRFELQDILIALFGAGAVEASEAASSSLSS